VQSRRRTCDGQGRARFLSFIDELGGARWWSADQYVSSLIAAYANPSRAPLMAMVCTGHYSWKHSRMAKSSCPRKSTDRPGYCLDLSYMHALLQLGYEVENSPATEIGK